MVRPSTNYLKPGKAKCLRCDKMFDSKDVRSNRICPSCTKINNRERLPRVMSTHFSDDEGTIFDVFEDTF